MPSNVGLLTYGTAAAFYLLLAALLVIRWRVRPIGPSLLFAAGATGAWAGAVAIGTLYDYPPITLMRFTELARNAGWLFVLLKLLGFQEDGDADRWLGRRWTAAFVGGCLAGAAVLALRPLGAAAAVDADDAAVLLWLVLSVLGLLLVEQLYRNAKQEERWGVKFLCLSLGMLFAYDLFMYAEALLFRELNSQLWQARGLVVAFTMPWLSVAIARNASWRMELQVSRHIVFHTVTLMGAGIYLLCMASIGYFIKYLGGNWGGVLQIGFLAGSGVLLATLLFSTALRARLRIFLSKHFFSYRYDYRVEWLRFTEGLGAVRNVPQGVVQIMAPITHSRRGLIIYRGAAGALSEVATWEMAIPEERDLGNIPDWITGRGWVIDLVEWRRSPDLYSGLELPTWLNLSETIWLIVPLFFQDELEGLLMLGVSDLKPSVNWEDRDLLKTAGRQAAAHLVQQRTNAALMEARQFEAFNRLSAYVIHDLKNILAQQSLMVANAQRHKNNPAFIDDMIHTVENSVRRMQRLMEQMRSGLRASEPAEIDLGNLLAQIVESRASGRPTPVLTLEAEAMVNADRERLATVFGHLLQNAQEATADDGAITVTLSARDAQGRMVEVDISDTGTGMSQEFIRERLFKAFDSTKGLTGMGIGAFESREYVRQLGGDITVRSQEGEGSTFSVSLPLVER